MHIIGKTTVDEQGRVSISAFNSPVKMSNIVIAVEVGAEMIVLLDDKPEVAGVRQKVDKKGRVILPKWLREELGKKDGENDELELFLIVDGDKKYLSPKTGSII